MKSISGELRELERSEIKFCPRCGKETLWNNGWSFNSGDSFRCDPCGLEFYAFTKESRAMISPAGKQNTQE